MATFHFDLVSPEKLAFSGEVDQVDVPGVEGDFGVLAGHAPVVAVIRPGHPDGHLGGTHQKIIVLGGLAEVSDKGLTVLADVATSIRISIGRSSPTRFPRWKPSSPRRKAPNSTAPSSGSITSRASSTSSTPRRCTRASISETLAFVPIESRVHRFPNHAWHFRIHRELSARLAESRSVDQRPMRRTLQIVAPRSGRPRAGTAPRDRRRGRAVPSATQSNSAGWPLRGVSGSISSSRP